MKTLKIISISTYSGIDISITKYLVISNFKKSFFILSFLVSFIGFSQTSNLYISPDTPFSGLEQLYVKETEAIPKETLQIKKNNSSEKFFVHSSTLVYFQTDPKINIVFIDSQNKTKRYHKDNITIVVTPKKTNKTAKVFVTSHNSNSGASSFIAEFAPIIPVSIYKKNNKIIAIAIHDVLYIKDLQKQNQEISFLKNIISFSLPIEYSNRPPPC